jgi:hypothetical protein
VFPVHNPEIPLCPIDDTPPPANSIPLDVTTLKVQGEHCHLSVTFSYHLALHIFLSTLFYNILFAYILINSYISGDESVSY